MMMAVVASRPKVTGIRSDTAAAGPKPGRTPDEHAEHAAEQREEQMFGGEDRYQPAKELLEAHRHSPSPARKPMRTTGSAVPSQTSNTSREARAAPTPTTRASHHGPFAHQVQHGGKHQRHRPACIR